MLEMIGNILIIVMLIISVAVAVLTVKYYKDKITEKAEWQAFQTEKLKDIGVVKSLRIQPLIDFESKDTELISESGVSYLIKADDKQIIFDVGFNMRNEHPSPLIQNMKKLNVNTSDIDNIFISHLHPDHVGGLKPKKNKTFALTGKDVDLKGKVAYVPVDMNHSTASIKVLDSPTKIAEGIVSIGNISRAIWGMGLTQEHGLAINVYGRGIVLVVGCGHQTAEKIIERADKLFNEPIYGIIGGLHFPVTKRNDFGFNIRRIIGTGKLPWRLINKEDVENTIRNIFEKDIKVIGISPHDSCDWTLEKFRSSFKDKYEDILVGKEIIIAEVK